MQLVVQGDLGGPRDYAALGEVMRRRTHLAAQPCTPYRAEAPLVLSP
jgi:hypothetical protein